MKGIIKKMVLVFLGSIVISNMSMFGLPEADAFEARRSNFKNPATKIAEVLETKAEVLDKILEGKDAGFYGDVVKVLEFYCKKERAFFDSIAQIKKNAEQNFRKNGAERDTYTSDRRFRGVARASLTKLIMALNNYTKVFEKIIAFLDSPAVFIFDEEELSDYVILLFCNVCGSSFSLRDELQAFIPSLYRVSMDDAQQDSNFFGQYLEAIHKFKTVLSKEKIKSIYYRLQPTFTLNPFKRAKVYFKEQVSFLKALFAREDVY